MLSFYAQPYVVMCTTSVSLYTHHLLSSLQASDKVSCCLWNLIPNKHVSFQLTATVLVCFHIITNSVWQITQSKPHYMWQLFRVFSHWWGWGSKILKRIPRLQWILDKIEIQAWLSASTPITIMPERTCLGSSCAEMLLDETNTIIWFSYKIKNGPNARSGMSPGKRVSQHVLLQGKETYWTDVVKGCVWTSPSWTPVSW